MVSMSALGCFEKFTADGGIRKTRQVSHWPRDPRRTGNRQQQAKLGTPASPQVIGHYRTTGFARWYPAVSAPLWLLPGTVQCMRMHQWWGLAFAAAWTALAVTVWLMPRTVISNEGVRFVGRRIITWSQLIDIVAQPNNGWKQYPPELVLRH